MARAKKQAPHENHERWLVSYADFITLLFAFFVVMFASSQTDKAKAKQVSDSVREALEHGGVPSAVKEILGGTVDDVRPVAVPGLRDHRLVVIAKHRATPGRFPRPPAERRAHPL